MPRRRMRAGEVGAIRVVVLANGQLQANARMRDELGTLCRLKVVRATEEEARRALDEHAVVIRNGGGGPTLTAYSTIAGAGAVFLDEKRRSETVEVSTIEMYEFSVNNVIIPECGNLLLTDLSVLRCNRILQHIRDTKSLSAARKARSMFSQICATGIEHGVLAFNPVRDARALPLPPKKESVLTPGQLETVRQLMRSWRAGMRRRCDREPAYRAHRGHDYPNPPGGASPEAFTETNPAEAAHRTAEFRGGPGSPATLGSGQGQGGVPVRHEQGPTAQPQQRRTVAPDLRRRQRGRTEGCRSRGGEFTTHIFRRTAATLIESVAGITLASRLLGHANEQVTRASYVVTAEMVDPVTAQIMDEALGDFI